jgi:outer membrane protein, heavy metal efflux system
VIRPLLVLTLAASAASAQGVLTLQEVLDSVNRSYPPLLAVLQDAQIAEGDMVSALGRFDTAFRARLDTDQLGFYDNRRLDVGVDQPLQFQGMNVFTGWRRGLGNFADYDGKLQTRDYGEFRAGARLPLFRDREIDNRRADLRKADLNREVAKLGIDQQKIVILQAATRRYWDWVAAGQRFRIAQSLLDLATRRNDILKEGVRLGQLPAIEVTENERAILQRRSQVVEGERGLQQAAIDLSLFYRDGGGQPQLAQETQLPPAFPELTAMVEDRVREDIETALRRRPEIQRFIVQRQQTGVDAQLAKNQLLPNVDVLMGFTAEGGPGNVKRGPQELKAAVVFDLPFQRRAAKGREIVAEARISQIDQRTRFTRDQVTAEVQDAISAVQAAYRRAKILSEEVRVARQLEDMERSRFDLGDSNQFFVNLREQASFDANVREVSAYADYFRAYALYELAIAEALAPTRRP